MQTRVIVQNDGKHHHNNATIKKNIKPWSRNESQRFFKSRVFIIVNQSLARRVALSIAGEMDGDARDGDLIISSVVARNDI